MSEIQAGGSSIVDRAKNILLQPKSEWAKIDAEPDPERCVIWIEDDGTGIPEAERIRIFDRGARLDTGKPGTGLGLAIVRDVAEIYGGEVTLGESEDLGGLLVRLLLPRDFAL